MANTQAIKRRIRSVSSTKQITKAMELVAASKMRRAQEATLRSRIYRNTAQEILTSIGAMTDVSIHPLFLKRKVKARLIIAISSDRGLAGAYNGNIFKKLVSEAEQTNNQGATLKVIAIGRQVARFASRLEGVELIGSYEKFNERPTSADILPILRSAMTQFEENKIDQVDVLYTDFISSISQTVRVDTLIPATFNRPAAEEDTEEAVFEPSAERVLDTIAPRLVEVQLFQALLESYASEHSMRMMAMKNASDNAGDLVDDLTIEFNGARQAAITQELAEITGGAEAIS